MLFILEQRQRIQLMILMYKKSKDAMHKVFPRNTRRIRCIVFMTGSYEGTFYEKGSMILFCML